MSLVNIEPMITLDIYDHNLTPSTIKAIALDSKIRYVTARIRNAGDLYDVGQNTSVVLTIMRPDKVGVQITGDTYSYTETTREGETVTLYGACAELTAAALAIKGDLKGQFKFTSGEQVLRTEIFTINNGQALDADIEDWAGDLDGHNLDEMAEQIEDAAAAIEDIQGDVSDLKEGLTQLDDGKTLVDVLSATENEFVTGRIVSTTTGVNAETTNTRYFACYPTETATIRQAKLKITGYEKLILETDTRYTARTTIAFFTTSTNAGLIGTPIYNNPTEARYVIDIPDGANYVNIGGYGTSNSNAPLGAASTKVYGVTSYFVGKMDTDLTSTTLPAQGKAVGDRLTVIEGKLNSNVKLNVPLRYELVVGDTFQLFHNGIILADKSSLFEVHITCAKGTPFSRYFEWTPKASEVGEYLITFRLYDPNHILLDEKTSNLVVMAKATNPSSEKVILYVGDSLTTGGYAPGEFKRRLVATDGTPTGDGLTNVTFIGSKTNGYVNYEGLGGRSWRSYIYEGTSSDTVWITAQGHGKTVADQHSIYKDANNKEWKIETIETDRIMIIRKSSSGTLPTTGTLTWVSGGVDTGNIVYTASENAPGNPFWNSSLGRVDIASYVTAQGANHLDYVYVLLGWNYFGANETVIKAYVRTFIDNVLASYPNCKVVLLGCEFPSKDGLAVNYGAKGTDLFTNYFGCVEQVCKLNTWYEEITQETAYLGKAFFVQTSGQFDTEYNMPTTTKTVNTRSAVTESVQNNGVHPSVNGYYQIADACYRDFVHRLQGS